MLKTKFIRTALLAALAVSAVSQAHAIAVVAAHPVVVVARPAPVVAKAAAPVVVSKPAVAHVAEPTPAVRAAVPVIIPHTQPSCTEERRKDKQC